MAVPVNLAGHLASSAPFGPRLGLFNLNPDSQPQQSSYIAALGGRSNVNTRRPVRLEPRQYEFVDGRARVSFTKEEDELLAEKCRLTVVGKFPRTRPQIDKLRDDFKRLVPMRGSFKIGVKDWRHVFIDFTDENDLKSFYGRGRSMPICGILMQIQRWTPNFTAEIESTLTPIWVTLPDLPLHYHDWPALERILDPIGTLIALDKATLARTRPTTAKARIEIDLTRPRLTEVEVALVDSNGGIKTFLQPMEYGQVPDFCFFGKMQGHSDEVCRQQLPKEAPAGHSGGKKPIHEGTKLGETSRDWTDVISNKKNGGGQRKKAIDVSQSKATNGGQNAFSALQDVSLMDITEKLDDSCKGSKVATGTVDSEMVAFGTKGALEVHAATQEKFANDTNGLVVDSEMVAFAIEGELEVHATTPKHMTRASEGLLLILR